MKKLLCYPEMRDGIRLVTWINLPGNGDGKYAAVLARNPYTQAPEPGTPEVQENLPEDGVTAQQFARVEQHCRGRGGSDGDFIPFENERDDGLDTIAWIEKQPWFDGRLYLWGGSYLGYVQLAMYEWLPPCVKGAATAVMANDGRYAFYQNGIFKSDVGPTWYPGMYHYGDLIHGSADASFHKEWAENPMGEYSRRIYGYDVKPFNDIWKLREDPMALPSNFTQSINCMKKLKIPVMMVTGWAEPFFNGTWRMWEEIPPEIRKKCAFLVGPWSHGPNVPESWHYPFVNGNEPGNPDLAWILHLRDGTPMNEYVREGCINYYHVGCGTWEHSTTWPDTPAIVPLYLTADQSLSFDAPGQGKITYRYDPLDPAWFPGGPNSFANLPNGFADQPEPNFRPDVISFVGEPLTGDLTLAGRVRAEIEFSTDCEATMFILRISCVQTNGVTTPMQDCPMDFNPSAPNRRETLTFETDPLCWTLHKGERIRVDVTSADAHSYRPHTNTAVNAFDARETRVAQNTVWCGQSRLLLPVNDGN